MNETDAWERVDKPVRNARDKQGLMGEDASGIANEDRVKCHRRDGQVRVTRYNFSPSLERCEYPWCVSKVSPVHTMRKGISSTQPPLLMNPYS